MASLIPGFEYDIFISYRQKDNKHDGWVSTFVDNLKGELESTFKEEISVYFDINPLDGLLETHDVESSLKDKLRCIVFIPIISRTYCDPKSFAWERELRSFIEMSQNDQFGMKVKLQGGNVASRVLPIVIYDLDPEDRDILEKELKGPVRGVEFIYREPGVNRPLMPGDDEKENLAKTKYRNQINKVANALREIINGVKLKHQQLSGAEASTPRRPLLLPVGRKVKSFVALRVKSRKLRKWILACIVLLLLLAGTDILIRVIGRGRSHGLSENEKSIAVLAFHNISSTDENQDNICDGLTSEIIGHLYKIRSFNKVVPFSTVLAYRKSDKKISEIAKELNVNFILEGTYKKVGDLVKVSAQLTDPDKENTIWHHEYDQPYRELISIQADIAIKIAEQVKAFVSNTERSNITRLPTTNSQAHELIQSGLIIWNTRNFRNIGQLLDIAQKSIKLDPGYADAYGYAGICTLLKGSVWGSSEMQTLATEASVYLEKALELDPENCIGHLGMALFNDWILWNYPKAESEFRKVLEMEPNNPQYHELYIEFLLKMGRPAEALKFRLNSEQEYRLIQSQIIVNKSKSVPMLKDYINSYGTKGYKYAGDCFLWMTQYDSAAKYLTASIQSGDSMMYSPRFQAYLALSLYKTGMKDKATSIIRRIEMMSNRTTSLSPDYFTGWFFSGTGQADSAFFWLEKALRYRSNQLAWLKIDPVFSQIRKDNRYESLYIKSGHKKYDDYISGANK